MSDNFQRFSAAIGEFTDQDIPQKVQQATQKIGLQALRGVVLKTPVDTGRARGNWNVTFGNPSTRVSENRDKPGDNTINKGSGKISRVEPFGRIYISNNLPYILPLENGWSTQAPTGMVSTTVTEIESQFRRID